MRGTRVEFHARLAKRNGEVISRYLSGERRAQIAASYFLTKGAVGVILRKAGVRLRREANYAQPLREEAGVDPMWKIEDEDKRRRMIWERSVSGAQRARSEAMQ